MSTINIDLAADTILNVMIGQQDENEVREVVFDFSGWYTTYGSGTISLAIQRPKDEWPYEGTLTVDSTNHKATWEISETDTAYAGTGQIQLSYKVGDAKKKSVVYRFTCHKSLGALGSVVIPVQIQTFIDEVEEALQTMDGRLDDMDGRLDDMEDEITDVKQDFKQALHDILEKVAYIDGDGQDYLDALDSAMWPPADLVSISAVYTQSGTVYDTDTLDSLKSDLVVTAHMSDSTTQTVTTYTLSGTLTEGTSTITVSYGGKTTTFTVTVTEAPPYTFYDYLQGDGTAFIDTGLSTKTYLADDYKKYVKFRLGTIQNEKTVFGARNAWGTTGVFIQINTASADRMNICFGNAWTKDTSPIANDLIEIELDHPTIKKNGETLGTVSNASVTQTSTTATIPLFCLWGGSSGSGSVAYNSGYVSQFFPYKIYRFTVTDKSNDTVIADMKPAMRISDNAVGMYDTVRDEFFTNARGSGVLTLGNDEA